MKIGFSVISFPKLRSCLIILCLVLPIYQVSVEAFSTPFDADQYTASQYLTARILSKSANQDSETFSNQVLTSSDVSSNESSTRSVPGKISATAATPSRVDSGVFAQSGSNRFVVWSDRTPGNFDIFFKRSLDSGATWKSTVNLSSNPGDSRDAAVKITGSNVYVVWTQYNSDLDHADIYVRVSTDNGATWGQKIKLSSSGENVNVLTQVAASGSFAYVVWSENNDEIYMRRSVDNGATWKAVKNLSNTPDPSTNPHIIALGSNVYVSWQEDVILAANSEIMLKRSTDNGGNWKPTFNVSDNGGESTLPQIAVAGQAIYIVWKDNSVGNYEIMIRQSLDGGITWKPSFNISSNPGRSTNPQLVAIGSNVYVTWEQDNVPPDSVDILVRASINNGLNWGSKIKLSSSGDNQNSIPHVAASGSHVYVVWSDSRDEIFLRKSSDYGVNWEPKKNLSANDGISNTAYIAASGTNISVVWNDNTDGDYDILFARSADNGSTWQQTVDLSNNAGNSLFTEEEI